MAQKEKYTVFINPLLEDEGGGWLATIPDLPGCMSDGDDMNEALANVNDAAESWFEAAEELGRSIPKPGSNVGKWRQRVPKTVHLSLKEIAAAEGVSLNALVTSALSEYLGQRQIAGRQKTATKKNVPPARQKPMVTRRQTRQAQRKWAPALTRIAGRRLIGAWLAI